MKVIYSGSVEKSEVESQEQINYKELTVSWHGWNENNVPQLIKLKIWFEISKLLKEIV